MAQYVAKWRPCQNLSLFCARSSRSLARNSRLGCRRPTARGVARDVGLFVIHACRHEGGAMAATKKRAIHLKIAVSSRGVPAYRHLPHRDGAGLLAKHRAHHLFSSCPFGARKPGVASPIIPAEAPSSSRLASNVRGSRRATGITRRKIIPAEGRPRARIENRHFLPSLHLIEQATKIFLAFRHPRQINRVAMAIIKSGDRARAYVVAQRKIRLMRSTLPRHPSKLSVV